MPVLRPQANEHIIKAFLQHCRRARYGARQLIITRGDPSDELLYVVKGSVSVLLEDERGHEIVLSYLNSGQFIGEIGLFIADVKRTAMVRARTPCEIARISYGRLQKLPEIFPDIVFLLAAQIATRLLKTNRRLRDLAFTDVSGRIARTLLELCKEPDAVTHPDGMQLRITRQEIGRIVGCSREVVGRVLKSLVEQNLVAVRGKTIVVFGVR